jgi:hypothetical protein
MTSLKQIEANRLNGKKAKGRKTIWGKIKSSKNALKHGLLAEQFLIVGENKLEYEEFKQGLIDYYNPQDQLQEEIVFQLISMQWRIRRSARVEAGIYGGEALDRPSFGNGIHSSNKLHVDEFKSSDVNYVPKQIEIPANSFIRDTNGASSILSINRIEANLMNRLYALLDRYKKIKEDADA